MLSDASLDALALLLDVIELNGQWPQSINAVVVPLIPKPKGGVRPIGSFSSVYRVWARSRRPEAEEWERANHRRFYAARKGNGALDSRI